MVSHLLVNPSMIFTRAFINNGQLLKLWWWQKYAPKHKLLPVLRKPQGKLLMPTHGPLMATIGGKTVSFRAFAPVAADELSWVGNPIFFDSLKYNLGANVLLSLIEKV